MTRDPRLSASQVAFLSRVRLLKSGRRSVSLDDITLSRLVGILERDLFPETELTSLKEIHRPSAPYYEIEPDTLSAGKRSPGEADFVATYLEAVRRVPDFDRIFEGLCEIHKRRLRFSRILAEQSMPEIEGLSHRSMLETGSFSPAALSAQMRVRKFLYDQDNRVAQEAAFLFMKLVASALGGAPRSAAQSPICRTDGDFRRRAVDCIVEDRAYDFKGRMTEAPSRRARLGDEIAFPRDCRFSGYRPILLALHRLPGDRSREIVDAYERNGGEIFTGEAAWAHLFEAAGPYMSAFLRTYVLSRMEAVGGENASPMDMTVRFRGRHVDYIMRDGSAGRSEKFRAARA